MSLNKIEKDLIKSLNNVNNFSNGLKWKVFYSSRTIKSDIELSQREKRIYEFLITEFEYNVNSVIFTVKQFNQLFLDWNNEKFSEKLTVIPSRKEVEKVLKYYFVNDFDKPNCFYYGMNSDDVEFIIKAKHDLGIYTIKQVETNTTENSNVENSNNINMEITENSDIETTENSDSTEKTNVEKITDLLNEIADVSKSMDKKEKIEIIHNLEKLLEVNATTTIIKNSGKKSA